MTPVQFAKACGNVLVAGLLGGCLWAQQGACRTEEVASIPSRPTIANATDTTQCGVIELEYGLERQWPGNGAHRSDLSGGLRLGLTPSLDFHWSAGNFLSIANSGGSRTGYGDNWFGLKYRILPQTKRVPSLGVMYQAKVPTGNAKQGMGSGEVDHVFSFLVSKDIKRVHCDFNVIPSLAGLSGAAGFDHNVGLALATWTPISRRWTLIAEPYGYTALNAQSPAFASAMIGASYRMKPRFVVDTGIDVGLSSGAPRKRVYGGVTYAFGNVFAWMK